MNLRKSHDRVITKSDKLNSLLESAKRTTVSTNFNQSAIQLEKVRQHRNHISILESNDYLGLSPEKFPDFMNKPHESQRLLA